MKGRLSEYDFLNLSYNYSIKSTITRDEEIQFSDKIYKFNKYNWKQERIIIITDKAIYNLKNLSLKRRIDLRMLIGITISKNSDEFVLHCCDIEYDYHYISKRLRIIIEIIPKNYEIILEKELPLFELSVKNLNAFVTSKSDKKKQPNFTRMPKNEKRLNIKDYLFGNKSKSVNISNSNTNPIAIIFYIPDQNMNYPIACLESDSFKIIEQKLFNEFPELKSKNIFYLANGGTVDKALTIKENNIKQGTTILINYID